MEEFLRAGADPDAIRRNALQCLCAITQSRTALLFLHRDGKLSKSFCAGEAVNADHYYEWVTQRKQNFRELISFVQDPHLRKRECLVMQLTNSDANIGYVILWPSSENSSWLTTLQAAGRAWSLFEQNMELQNLFEVNQKKLRALSENGATIASRNSHLFERLMANQERLMGISKGVIRMQEEERSKISRELHDGIGQLLSALKMNIDSLSNEMERSLSPKASERLREVKRQVEQSVEDVRELSRLLRPRMLDDLGLAPTLRWYVRTFCERSGVRTSLKIRNFRKKMKPEVETVLFRITQEALNNIWKHSKSSTADVCLQSGKEWIELKIQDQGVGFSASYQHQMESSASGSGLPGIRDRVSLWNGELIVKSKKGTGVTLIARIPIQGALRKAGKGSR